MSSDDLKAKLTPIQYTVTQEDGTEAPFKKDMENIWIKYKVLALNNSKIEFLS